MPDFEPLFELKENLYKETCPVLLQSGVLLRAEAAEGEEEAEPRTFARLVFRNLDSRSVTALFLDLHVFDKANAETEVIRDRRYLVPVAGRDETFGEDVELTVSNAAKSFSVAIKKVEFEGEDVWNGSASLLFEYMPPRQELEKAIEDEKLLAQYRRDYNTSMSEAGKGEAVYVPDTYKDLWLCTCGELNRSGEEKCYSCGAAYEPQRELFDDREKLAENLEVYEKAEAEKAEQARLAAERKAAEEKAAAEEAARKAAEEKAAAEERARRKKLHKKIFLSISIPLTILIALFIVVLITYIIPQKNYDAAALLLENGQYDDAVAAFAELEGYSDSEVRITESKYRKGVFLLEDGKYDEAIALFEEVAEYEDAAEQITEAKYRKAMRSFDAGAYSDARQQFEALDGYKDCAALIEQCYFEIGMLAVAADQVEIAAENYEKVSGDLAAELETALCDKGVAVYEAGNEEHALEYFALVTSEALLPKIDAAYYAQGLKLVEKKAYDEAMEIFTKLGEYEDCPTQILRIHYLKAEAAYASADYKTAIEEYTAAGDYEKASSKLTETTYQYGLQLFNAGKTVEAYNVLYPIRSYEPAYMLLITKSQFYISVYDAGLGPNPMNE